MQFRLSTLLIVFVVFWSAMAAFGLWGISLAVVFVLMLGLFRAANSSPTPAPIVALAVAVVVVLMLLVVPVRRSAHLHGWPQCSNNLKEVSMAILMYHNQWSCLPPACTGDKNGTPLYSWRALLWTHLGREDIFRQYKFTEPWNGPDNGKLSTLKFRAYACPGDDLRIRSPASTTSYVAVIGPKTIWPGPRIAMRSDLSVPNDTISVLEIAESDIPWAEPRDLTYDEAVKLLSAGPGDGAAVPHWVGEGYFVRGMPGRNVALLDGSVRFLPQGLPRETVERLLTLHDGEAVDWPTIEASGQRRLNWSHCIGLAMLIFSSGLLVWCTRAKDEQPREIAGG